MDAVEFLKEKARLTKNCGIECRNCRLFNIHGEDCHELMEEYPEEAVKIVGQWGKDCPRRTRLVAFKELFPQYMMQTYCPQFYDVNHKCIHDCKKCMDEFWNEEMPDNDRA